MGGAKLGYLLAGAGARAIFQAGVLSELFKQPEFSEPEIFAGTSGGAINAALLAAGKTPDDVRDFWLGFASDPPVDANTSFFRTTLRAIAEALVRHGVFPRQADRGASLWWAAKRLWRHRVPDPGNVLAFVAEMVLTRNYGIVSHILQQVPDPAVLNMGPLRARLVQALGGEKVQTRKGVRLAVNAVDICSCRPARFVNVETELTTGSPEYTITDTVNVDMVLGSAAIPFLLPAIAINDRRLWDGGLLVNTPLASAVSLGADAIVPIMSNALPGGSGSFKSMGDALQRIADVIVENCFNLDRKLLLERNRISKTPQTTGKRYREVTLYEAIRPNADAVFDTGSYLNFSRSRLERMYEQGRDNARIWLARETRVDKLK